MNPGLAVKLRPTGPWRIGPDSGARNRVDVIYHSDSLFSAVTGAMVRLGRLEEWLGATARSDTPEVRFSSCFPFADEVGFVAPPRTVWPPASPSLMAARVRWKSARFIPLGMVQSILAGEPLDERQWSVDGESGCLVPAGRLGPFRTSVRWAAAVDRLTGASERHATACIEFRAGAGLWTVVEFAHDAARERWQDAVKSAFRWLADAGFGGERSRGWGRSEAPEFIEGTLPDMILAGGGVATGSAADAGAAVAEPTGDAEQPGEQVLETALVPEAAAQETESEPESAPAIETLPTEAIEPARPGSSTPVTGGRAHWLLSLFTPAPGDSIDWARGSYSVIARGGRIDSPAGSGELKKQIQMVTEGSVLVAGGAPVGAASDVAPDGFAHPVFRAGFALAIPLPEAH